MNRIELAIDNLLTKSKGEINSRIDTVVFDIEIKNTKSKAYCHCLKIDGNGSIRLQDLIEFIDGKIVEYALPKKEIDEAFRYQQETGSPAKTIQLRRKAVRLFTDLEKTGEGGEILLYILVQEYLKIPQLISKMSLKTSGKLHYQGADGIHVKFDTINNSLNLYWGESKMYSNHTQAISECFKSIKSFLLDPISYQSMQERDIELITANIANNVNNNELENALVRYFDKDDDLSNNLVYKGICFIGFDFDGYTAKGIVKTTQEVKNDIEKEIDSWYNSISNEIKKHGKLNLKEIHVFLMPFPSVAEFRKYYLETIQ